MSPFERLMMNRLDSFEDNQRNLYDLYVSNFQRIDNRFDSMDARFMTLDEQIEAVQNQIFDLQNVDDDEWRKTTGWCIETTDCFFGGCISFSFCCFCSLILMYSKQLSCVISSLCLFVKTNRGRYMLCLISVFFSSPKQFGWVKPYRFLILYLFVVYSDIMLWISVFVSVLTKY